MYGGYNPHSSRTGPMDKILERIPVEVINFLLTADD